MGEIDQALRSIPDVATQLGAKLVLYCGLRRFEVCGLTLDGVFNERNRKVNGKRFIRVLGKNRKWRDVEIDDDLFEELAEFRETERGIRLHQHRQKSDILLIRDTNGKPFSVRSFWLAFREKMTISPHVARHFYAVTYLLRDWKRQELAANKRGLTLSLGMMQTLLTTALIALKENLGHASLSTTEKYLVLLRHYIDHANISLTFQDLLDGAARATESLDAR